MIFIGLLIIAIGAFCQSSCYVPINKIKDWSWESYWIVQGIFAWLVLPLLGAMLAIPEDQSLMVKGILMLLCYSMGLGIPFVVSAVLIDKLKGAFSFIKSNYIIINKICGAFLVIVGISMATGLLGRLLTLLS